MSVSVVTRITTSYPSPEARQVVRPAIVERPLHAPAPARLPVDTLTISASPAPHSPVNTDSAVDRL